MRFIKNNRIYICFFICFLFLLWRSFKGFCWSDESFYISTADRFYRGAVPLVDEWYRTQMSSILMLPFYSVYVLLSGGTDGIVLYFRLLYLILTVIIAVVYFRVLRKDYPDTVSAVPALFVMCYAHLNNATFSYYMLSNLLLILGLILIYDYRNTCRKSELVFAGVVIALAVFCMPLMAVGYIAVMAAVFIVLTVNRIFDLPDNVKKAIDNIRLGDIALYTVIGVAVPAVLFLVYLFTHTDIDYLINTLPVALVDNEHAESLGYFIRKPNRCLVEVYGTYTTYASYLLIAVSFVFQKLLKKDPFRTVVVLADVAVFVIMASHSIGRVGYIQVAFFMFMIPVFFVSERKNHFLFFLTTVPAVLVALIYCFASSDFLYVMAIGAAVATGAGVAGIYDHIAGSRDDQTKNGVPAKITGILLTGVVAFSLCITFVLRMTNVYRDAPIPKLNQKITTGVAKGLYTTGEHLEQYTDVYDMIDEYCQNTDGYEVISGSDRGNVLFSKILPWGYTASALNCGYPTTWRATAYDEDQLKRYYEVNPEAVPDIIVVLDSKYGSYDAAGDVEDDHEPNLDEMNDFWKKYITDNGFTEKKVKCAKVYCKIKQ